jgi:hypothetical protein
MDDTTKDIVVGRLTTRSGELFGFLAVAPQELTVSRRVGLRRQRWSETRLRYRLDLERDWDDGYLSAEDEAELAEGRFLFKGEVYAFQELAGNERRAELQRFEGWE